MASRRQGATGSGGRKESKRKKLDKKGKQGGTELQKFLFYAVQVFQSHSTTYNKEVLHVLRDLWLVLNEGYFRQAKGKTLPPNPKKYVSPREIEYVEQLLDQLAATLGVLMMNISHSLKRHLASADLNHFRKHTETAWENPEVERSKLQRIQSLAAMILVIIAYDKRLNPSPSSPTSASLLSSSPLPSSKISKDLAKLLIKADLAGPSRQKRTGGSFSSANVSPVARCIAILPRRLRVSIAFACTKPGDIQEYVASLTGNLNSSIPVSTKSLSASARTSSSSSSSHPFSPFHIPSSYSRPSSSSSNDKSLSFIANSYSADNRVPLRFIALCAFGRLSSLQLVSNDRSNGGAYSRGERKGGGDEFGDTKLGALLQETIEKEEEEEDRKEGIREDWKEKETRQTGGRRRLRKRNQQLQQRRRLWPMPKALEELLEEIMQQTYGNSIQKRSDSRKSWSMMTLLSFPSMSGSATKGSYSDPSSMGESGAGTAGQGEHGSTEEVDTVLMDTDSVRSSLSKMPQKLRRFDANLKYLRVGMISLNSWLRMVAQNQRRLIRADNDDGDDDDDDDDWLTKLKEGEGKKLGDTRQQQQQQQQQPARGMVNVAAKMHSKREQGQQKRIQQQREGGGGGGSLTLNQQKVFRRLSHRFNYKSPISYGNNRAASASSSGPSTGGDKTTFGKNKDPSFYGEKLANALTIHCIRIVQLSQGMLKAEMKAATLNKDYVWSSISSPFFNAPEAHQRHEFHSAAVISAIELLSLNCSLAQAKALPLRVALQLENLSHVLTDMLQSPDVERLQIGKKGNMILSIIDFFIKHPSSTYNAESLIELYFKRCLSSNFMEPILAYSTVQFCVKNCETLLKNHLTVFFPLLFKIFALFPISYVQEAKVFVRFLAIRPKIKCEVLNTILDLPLLAALVQYELRLRRQNKLEEWERFTSKHSNVCRYMLRDRSSSSSQASIQLPSSSSSTPHAMQRPSSWEVLRCQPPPHSSVATSRTTMGKNVKTRLAAQLRPTLLNIYFDCMLQTVTMAECKKMVASIIERVSCWSPQRRRLLAMFEKYPALVVNTKLTLLQSIKRSAATTSFSQLPQHRQQQILAIQIIWLIGEYLQTEHTHTEFKVVVEYQQVLAQVIDTQMAIHVAICKANDTDGAIRSPRHSGRGKDSGSSNSSRIAPPRVLMGLLDNRSNSVYGGYDGSSPSYHYQQQHQPHYHSRKDTLSVQRESDGHNIGGDRKADGISYIQSLSGGEEIATRLIHVSLMALCKLAARCVELVPSVRAILIRVLGNRSMLPASVSLRASQCARLLQQPSIAYSLFKEPFFCSPHLNENTPLTLMTNHPDASDFIIPQKNRSFIPSNESNITVAKDPSPAAPLR
eukprot:jgi/Bigna1/80322/fgenesh1_pg.70_\